MSIEAFLRLVKQHLLWFIGLPALTAGMAFYMTRNEPKIYKSDATLYTGLASGYSLLSDQQTGFRDQSANAFDNLLTTLNSKETLLQVGESLLAEHLRLTEPDTLVLGPAGYARLYREISPTWRQRLPLNGDSLRLRAALDSLAKTPGDNPVKALLLTSDSYYAIGRLGETLKATARKSTNDVLLMEYEADDPAVAQRTLRYAIALLNKRYSFFKTSETNSVLSYYQVRLEKARQKLDQAEASLRAFSVQHNVLDYDEEAKNVAASREALTGEYNQELMRRDAAKAAMDALNRRLNQQSSVNAVNTELSVKQRKLTEAEGKLANARAYGQPNYVISRLQNAVGQAADELKASAQAYDAAVNSTDAVPNQTVANDRLAKTLEYEESAARLELYQQRMAEYQAKTDEFGPLGSQLRQLNRALGVAEKEYLDMLQHVAQSQTRQQDVAIGGTMEVLDAPNFPLVPQASKRSQLIGVGLGVGLFIALLLTALRFWFDKRILTPEAAETRIGQPVTVLFPTVKKAGIYSKAGLRAHSLFEQLANAINIEIAQTQAKPYPPLITLFSIRPRQGKTWVATGLTQLYADANQQVAYCYPREPGREEPQSRKDVICYPYTVRPDFMNVTGVDYLLDHNSGFDATQYDRIILELPSLINHQIPVYLLNGSVLSLLVVDAGSTWARAEGQLLNLYRRVTSQPLLTVLNRVDASYGDALTGLIPMPIPSQTEPSRQPQRNEIE